METQGRIASPTGPIAYVRDAWGYPRIRVTDAMQGAWARGWFHAVDRRLQVELSRYAAEGRLMEILGDEAFTRAVDRNVRTLGLAEGLEQELAALTDEARAFCEAYCEGFAAGSESAGLPWPGRLLGLERRPWTPRDLLLTYRLITWFGLNSLTQTGRMAVAQLIVDGVGQEALRKILGPGAEGLDLKSCAGLELDPAFRQAGIPVQRGSNAFAVSAARSASGSPLLVSEFHMEIARFPPVVHMSTVVMEDGGYLQGISIPGVPLVSAGRTPHLAWGYTFGHADNVDVTVQRCRDRKRRVGDGWEPVGSRRERVKIRRGKEETWTVWTLGRAALLGDPSGPEERSLVGLEWRGMHETASGFNGALPAYRSTSVEEVIAVHRTMRTGALAGVFADREHIGWMHLGRVAANRAGWGPRPGWDLGEDPDIAEDARPVKVDPPEGYVASANEACAGWTAFPEPRYRHERLCALLDGEGSLSADDLLRVSYDEHDGCAARLLPVWGALLPAAAADMVRWAGMPGARHHMARFHALHVDVSARYIAESLGAPLHPYLTDTLFDFVLQDCVDDVLALEHPEHLDRDGLSRLLSASWKATEGAAPETVAGPVRTRFVDLITQGKLPAFLGLSSRAVDLPGGPTSLFASRRTFFAGHQVISGPAFHLVLDMAEPGLRYNIAGGASERRFGPGYGAGLDAFLTGELLRAPTD